MIWFFYLLLVKHAIADLWLQGRLNKPKFGSKDNLLTPKLWLHCLDHAVLTLIIALLFVGLLPALMFAVLDFVTHLIIDYAKNRYVSILENTICRSNTTLYDLLCDCNISYQLVSN